MKVEVSVNSQNMTAEDVLYSIFSSIVSAWDALLLKFSVKERFAKLFRILCFVLALELSFGLLLATIICSKDVAVTRFGILASILLAVYSCKKLYPKI